MPARPGKPLGTWRLFQTPLSAEDLCRVMVRRFSLTECIERLKGRFEPKTVHDAYVSALAEHRAMSSDRLVRLGVAFPVKHPRRIDCSPAAIATSLIWAEQVGLR